MFTRTFYATQVRLVCRERVEGFECKCNTPNDTIPTKSHHCDCTRLSIHSAATNRSNRSSPPS